MIHLNYELVNSIYKKSVFGKSKFHIMAEFTFTSNKKLKKTENKLTKVFS